MSSRREEILKEMGLSPLWRLRERPEGSADAANGAAVTHARSMVVADESPITRDKAPVTRHRSVPIVDPSPPENDRRAVIMRLDWAALKDAVAGCHDCALHARRNKTVFGVGDENAEWMFVGEGPGAEEDLQGEPFVGQAGRLLDNMLAAVDLKRGKNVYIANVVKCLRYNALVQLGDGSWERIGRLVNSRYNGDVMSVDESGTLVRRKVTG